jgi:GxxExxY protein
MKTNQISEAVIGAAIDVHREIGPGLVENVYEESLCHELNLRNVAFLRQQAVAIRYKGVKLSVPLWLDLLVEEQLVVDLKAKEQVTPLDKAQLRTYLRLSGLRVGLILNFHVERLIDGVTRVVNKFSDPDEPSPDLHG